MGLERVWASHIAYVRVGAGWGQVILHGPGFMASHIAYVGVRGVLACQVSGNRNAGDQIWVQSRAPQTFLWAYYIELRPVSNEATPQISLHAESIAGDRYPWEMGHFS